MYKSVANLEIQPHTEDQSNKDLIKKMLSIESQNFLYAQKYDDFVPSTMSTLYITGLCSKYLRNVCQPNSSNQTRDQLPIPITTIES